MKCENCGRAIYLQRWEDWRGDVHQMWAHLQTNRDQCLLPGRIVYAKAGS